MPLHPPKRLRSIRMRSIQCIAPARYKESTGTPAQCLHLKINYGVQRFLSIDDSLAATYVSEIYDFRRGSNVIMNIFSF